MDFAFLILCLAGTLYYVFHLRRKDREYLQSERKPERPESNTPHAPTFTQSLDRAFEKSRQREEARDKEKPRD